MLCARTQIGRQVGWCLQVGLALACSWRPLGFSVAIVYRENEGDAIDKRQITLASRTRGGPGTARLATLFHWMW